MNSKFDSLSPIDYRYWDEEVAEYLSERAFIRYKLQVELALVKVLAKRNICKPEVVQEVERAIADIMPEEVYEEEQRIKHDIRALVNCIRSRVSEEAKPFVHMAATSFDISDTANVGRFKDVIEKVVITKLLNLEKVLIEITLREAETIQIGRTHGQHAVPITFGFAMAEYVNRIGECIVQLRELSTNLPGKFSGAVGAYNASLLFVEDPEEFEKEVLQELGLKPAMYSTQIIPPEPMTRLLSELVLCGGVMANLARDMRHLQRTEIGEVGEEFEAEQVGSSTMPQKRNPINFENIESLWKVIVGRLPTVYLDQVSEHQRDLTNSASQRTYGEIVAYVSFMSNRLTETMKKLQVDHSNLKRNLEMQKGMILAEPLYIILAQLGYPDAHAKVRQLTLQIEQEQRNFSEVIEKDMELAPYLEKMNPSQKKILSDPATYTGLASQKATKLAKEWTKRLNLSI